MALKPIEIILNAKDNASKVFDGLNAKMTAIAAAIAGYFGVNAFANVITGAANFEEAMSRVQAATNASGAELEKLKVAAEQAGANTKFTAIEAASALENLAKAGLSSSQAIEALPAVLNMAQAGGVSLADASDRLTGAVMGMGLSFSESARVADVLALGANSSKTSINGMAEAMSYAAPIAKQVGLSLESTVAIIGQFSNANIDASRAGTALNSILAQFSDPASKFRDELAAIGIRTNDFDKALKQLAAAGPSGAAAIRAVGLEAGPALQGALNLGIPALEALRAKLGAAEGSAAATAKIMGDNLNGALKGLASAWDTVKNKLGEPVLPVLKSGVDELAGALKKSVEDGTIAKFGTSLATAFQAAVEWMRQFMGTVDFGKVTADMQAFAGKTKEVFDQIGQYATNAGNIVKLAYGVMSGGSSTALGAIYGIGEAFAGVTSNILYMMSKVREAQAAMSFGPMAAEYKKAAEELKLASEGAWAASEAMAKKSRQAFMDVADGATLARAGYEELSDAAKMTKAGVDAYATASTGAGTASQQAQQGIEAMREAMRKESEAAFIAMDATEKQAEAMDALAFATEKKAAADKSAEDAIKLLWQSYVELVQSGDLQAAAAVMQSIEKAQTDAGNAAKKSAEEVKAASAATASIAPAAKTAADSINTLRESAIKEGDAWLEAANKIDVANKAKADSKQATEAAAAAVKALNDEYKAAVAAGYWQKAAELQGQINQAMRDTAPAAAGAGKAGAEVGKQIAQAAGEAATEIRKLQSQYKEALDLNQWEKAEALQRRLTQAIKEAGPANKEAAEAAKAMAAQVDAAYAGLGVSSTARFKELANQARANFEIIKNSGTASAIDIGKAFAAYAEKAIAANGGVATSAIKAEAALRGYKVEVDDTGKNTLKLVTATDGLAASFAKAAEAAKSKAAVMKADNDLALSGLNLRKSEIDSAIAVAQAQGKESEVIKLKIEQKKIEIAIIQATVKAQIDEAQSSISVAEAKMSELRASGSLTAEKKAELEAEIKSARAKINDAKARGESVRVLEQEIKGLQGSTSGYNNNASAIDNATAALEALNAQRERGIAAQEKANELKKREIDLYNEKWKMDADHNSVDASGKKIEAVGQTQESLYNAAKDAGLTVSQSKDLADQYAPRRGINGYSLFDNNGFWKSVNELKQQNDLNAERTEADKKRQEGQAAQQEEQRRKEEDTRKKQEEIKPAPAPPALTPNPAPAPPPAWNGNGGSASIAPAPSYTSIVNLPNVGKATVKFDNPSDQAQLQTILSALTQAAGVAQ